MRVRAEGRGSKGCPEREGMEGSWREGGGNTEEPRRASDQGGNR